jgi:hypothetical protein
MAGGQANALCAAFPLDRDGMAEPQGGEHIYIGDPGVTLLVEIFTLNCTKPYCSLRGSPLGSQSLQGSALRVESSC